MSKKKQVTLKKWLQKAGNEGGVLEGFEYGLRADDIKANINDHDTIALLYRVQAHYFMIKDDVDKVNQLIEEIE